MTPVQRVSAWFVRWMAPLAFINGFQFAIAVLMRNFGFAALAFASGVLIPVAIIVKRGKK